MAWTTLTLQVATPLFNGGADPDGSAGLRPADEAGIRVASIRGAMRFWFRALAGCATGPDLGLLADLERRVFGGAADQGQAGNGHAGSDQARKGSAASPLAMRLPSPPSLSHEAVPGFLSGRDGRSIGYLLGLGLMKLERGRPQLTRPFVPDGETFELKLRFQHAPEVSAAQQQAIEALSFASLWLTCTYGGVGARTRRGFGGLRIVGVDGDLPRPWTPFLLQVPGLDYYNSAEFIWPGALIRVFQNYLRVLCAAENREIGDLDEWTSPPPFPVLSEKYAPAALTPMQFTTWEQSAAYAGQQLRLFRANRPVDRSSREQSRVRTAEWDDVINGDSARFPLGAVGLPVNFHEVAEDYRGEKVERDFVVNAGVLQGSKLEKLRRASPLWLRPVGADQTWRMFTFAFQTGFLPGLDAARVRLWSGGEGDDAGQGDDLVVEQSDLLRLTAQWVQTMRRGASFVGEIRE